MRTQHNFNLAVLQLAEELGVDFAFPTQTLHVESVAATSAPGTAGLDRGAPDAIAASFKPDGEHFKGLSQRSDLPTD